jgi:hypothetical protein
VRWWRWWLYWLCTWEGLSNNFNCLIGTRHVLGSLLEVEQGSEAKGDAVKKNIKFFGCISTKVYQHSIALGFPVDLDG